MLRYSLKSIRARLTLGFSLTTTCLVILACAGLIGYAGFSANRRVETLLRTTKQHVEAELQDTVEPENLRDWMRERGPELAGDDLAAILVDSRGRFIQQTQKNIPRWPRTGHDGWRVVTVTSGGDTLVIGFPWAKQEAGLLTQAVLLSALSLFVIIVTGIAAWALVGQTLSPIGLLSRQSKAASTDRLRVSLSPPSQDAEVVELVTTLNALLGRLADTAAARGRFYAAASHELRTPLQALSGHLELAMNRSRCAEEYRAVIEEALGQTRRLTSLAQDLLFLNRLETASSNPPCHPVDLPELCERLLTHFQPTIARRGLRTQINLAEDAVVCAPPMHLEMLARNLIENAVKYASPGGTVRIAVRSSAEGVRLEVFNTFPPDPHLEAEALYEAFYRPDQSRNSETGGNGLGLTICKALTMANGWQLEWRHESDGIRAIVRFLADSGPA